MLYIDDVLDPIRRLATVLHGPCEVEFVSGEIVISPLDSPLVTRQSLAALLCEIADQCEWSVQSPAPWPEDPPSTVVTTPVVARCFSCENPIPAGARTTHIPGQGMCCAKCCLLSGSNSG